MTGHFDVFSPPCKVRAPTPGGVLFGLDELSWLVRLRTLCAAASICLGPSSGDGSNGTNLGVTGDHLALVVEIPDSCLVICEEQDPPARGSQESG